MKSFLITATLIAFATAPLACNKSPEGGNPGTKDSFNISAPVLETKLKQGEVRILKVKLDRGTDFKKGVKLEATAPKGLTVEDFPKTVAASESADVDVKVKAADDAPVGDALPIVITATPDAGVATKVSIKVEVQAAGNK